MRRIVESVLPSYYELIRSLVRGCTGMCVLDGELETCGSLGEFAISAFVEWLRQQQWQKGQILNLNLSRTNVLGEVEVALALVDSSGKLIAVISVAVSRDGAITLGPDPAAFLRQRIKPALDCLHRELGSAARAKSKTATLTERTRDLEWLFEVANELKGGAGNEGALEHLLASGTERMRSAFGALIVPGQKLLLQHTRRTVKTSTPFQEVRAQAQAQVIGWVERHRRPLIMNQVGSNSTTIAPCKLLAVPITPREGKALGVLLFLRAPEAPDFVKRQAFLAAHIARHVASLLQSQYDLATGLLTRTALEQSFESLPEHVKNLPHCVLQVDIDQLHVINSVHGFEAGDEVIVRVAQLLGPPTLPPEAMVGRISGDQFLIILPSCEVKQAESLAAQLQQAAAQAAAQSIGHSLELTLSCGISPLKNEHEGLLRAIVAAQTACKAAKDRGRNRIEIYASDDLSIVQRQGDALRVGSIREALRDNQFELYTQPIVPLRNPELSGGFEVLLRVRNADSTVGTPSDFLSAAERYQLMPSIDQWVIDNTLALIETQVSLLVSRRLSFSVNVTAHSLTDDRFVDFLTSRMRSSRFPPGLVIIEITEQSAVRNLPYAARLMNRLREVGCGVALDDFGTGSNSLAYLRDLPVTRVKIDGSFVRDILTNPRCEPTLKGIVQLLHPFKVETVAEYVETEAIAQRLRRLSIDYGQGYAFGKPEPMTVALQKLKLEESQRLRKLALEI